MEENELNRTKLLLRIDLVDVREWMQTNQRAKPFVMRFDWNEEPYGPIKTVSAYNYSTLNISKSDKQQKLYGNFLWAIIGERFQWNHQTSRLKFKSNVEKLNWDYFWKTLICNNNNVSNLENDTQSRKCEQFFISFSCFRNSLNRQSRWMNELRKLFSFPRAHQCLQTICLDSSNAWLIVATD